MSNFHLSDWQKKCLKSIKDKSCVILASPTGSGKTACYEEWALDKKERPIFITAPIKALSNQRYRDLSAKGYKVGLETGDVCYLPDSDCDIICCTQEIYNFKYRHIEKATVIIDEFSYIYDDTERSRAYIDSLIYSNATNIMICSATFGNTGEVLEYIKKVSGRDFYLFENKERLTELEYIGSIPMNKIHDSFIVAYSKDDCYLLAKKLYQQRIDAVRSLTTSYDPRNRYKGKIKEIAKKYEIKNNELIEFALMGVVYYCGKLLPKEKLFVEELLENRYVDSVVGTNALALGVNFPIESVVFSGLRNGTGYKNPRGNKQLISKNMFEQLSGRAGRKKYFDKGYVYYCNDFYNLSLNNDFWHLVKSPNEPFRVVLGSDIKSILSGELSIEEDSLLRVKYSTTDINLTEITEKTKEVIEFVKTLDVTKYYFKKVYGIDISNGFYSAISHLSPKRQQELEDKSKDLANIQSIFEQDISKVYMSEFSVEHNCIIFIDILIGISLERLLKINCYSYKNNEYDVKALLDLRKYLNKLPTEYLKNYDLSIIDNLINSIDPTILKPYRYVSNSGDKNTASPLSYNKNSKKTDVINCPKRFDIVEYKGKKYIKIMVEENRILLCEYDKKENLKLFYIPLRSIYMTVGYITANELSFIWPKIDFTSFEELNPPTLDSVDSLEGFLSYKSRRKKHR